MIGRSTTISPLDAGAFRMRSPFQSVNEPESRL